MIGARQSAAGLRIRADAPSLDTPLLRGIAPQSPGPLLSKFQE
jgi:hypothetical protein